MEPTHDAYSWVAQHYDRFLEPLNAPLRQLTLRQFPMGPGMRVLDVGCGTGAHLDAFADTGASCWGVDLSPGMLEVAKDRLPDSVDLRLGDATDLPFGDGFFDTVFTSLFLHELDSATRSAVLGEMGRVTATDGRMIVIDYRSGDLRWKGRAWRAFSTVTERIAGTNHYGAWRAYLADGGVASQLPPGLVVESEKIVAGGNLALWGIGHAAQVS
ncbi:MAG: class I SAM-dependent methyltransferase [Acidimicrobiia bacterium]